MLRYSAKLQDAFDNLPPSAKESIRDEVDATVYHSKFDSPASAFEQFESGYELARDAENNGFDIVWYFATTSEQNHRVTHFMMGDSEEELIKRLKALEK